MRAALIDDHRRVVILVDHLHGHEPPAGIRKRHGDRGRVEVEDPSRVQRVTIHPDDVLLVDSRWLAAMSEHADAGIADERLEVVMTLGPLEIVDVDSRTHRSPRPYRCPDASGEILQQTLASF